MQDIVEVKGYASSDDHAHDDNVAAVVQDDSRSESEDFHGQAATSTETVGYCSQMGSSTSCIKGDLDLCRKRSADVWLSKNLPTCPSLTLCP